VLGYHYNDSKNQANDLFYLFSKTCFEELQKLPNHKITFPANFFRDLNKGVCIEQLTHLLITKNPGANIQSVWEKYKIVLWCKKYNFLIKKRSKKKESPHF